MSGRDGRVTDHILDVLLTVGIRLFFVLDVWAQLARLEEKEGGGLGGVWFWMGWGGRGQKLLSGSIREPRADMRIGEWCRIRGSGGGEVRAATHTLTSQPAGLGSLVCSSQPTTDLLHLPPAVPWMQLLHSVTTTSITMLKKSAATFSLIVLPCWRVNTLLV